MMPFTDCSSGFRSTVNVISASTLLLALAACGDPAPGEGMEKPLARKPLPEVVSAREALQTPDLTIIDPATMDKAEIHKVIPAGPQCSFAYTAESFPVLAGGTDDKAAGGVAGVVKLHGRLVELSARQAKTFDELTSGVVFTADGIQLTVTPDPDNDASQTQGAWRRPANLIFELDQGLRVGYRGWYSCRS